MTRKNASKKLLLFQLREKNHAGSSRLAETCEMWDNMSKLLNNLHEITVDLQEVLATRLQDSQHQLKYATISFLPEDETTQELKSRCSYREGIVSRNVETFQKYINQRDQNNKNPSL